MGHRCAASNALADGYTHCFTGHLASLPDRDTDLVIRYQALLPGSNLTVKALVIDHGLAGCSRLHFRFLARRRARSPSVPDARSSPSRLEAAGAGVPLAARENLGGTTSEDR